ncbi:MAG: retroviral-like aspartic protease family protein [Gemmataceae bacterium]|nr:retroviral-like aspartic protease family protein [Gemmataceae bacterium]
MSMTFPYNRFNLAAPRYDGKGYRAKPIFTVTLIGPSGSVPRDGLADSGADDTVFPDSDAALLGIDLTNAPTGTASGVGMAGATTRYAQVTLRITDGIERREWTAWVGFVSVPLRRPLLGQAGFLEFFNAKFKGRAERLVLMVNRSYVGS